MAYTLNRRLAQLIDSNGQLNTGKIPNDYITSDHIADNTITSAMLHTSFTVSTSNLTAIDTDDVSEGSSNLYYTDARVGTYISGNRDYGNITTTGYIAGPSTFTIDPAAVGDNTGTVVIAGNLQVDGTTTTINSTTMEVDDLNITLASGAANAAAANGAGITVDCGSDTDATFIYDGTNDVFDINKGLTASGNVGIGITPTEGKLHVKSDGAGEVELLTLENSTGTNGITTLTFKTTSTDATKSAQIFAERINASGHTDLAFRTFNGSTTEHMRIDADGKVGIGTNDPSQKMEISGNLRLGGMILKNTSDGGSIGFNRNPDDGTYIGNSGLRRFQLNGPGSTSGDYWEFQSYNSSGTSQGNIRIQDGNLGIGTTPSEHLHVNSGTSTTVAKFQSALGGAGNVATVKVTASGNSSDGLRFIQCGSTSLVEGGANAATIENTENAPLLLGTNGTERMRISSSGNVGIGGSPTNYSDHKTLSLYGNTGTGAGFIEFNDTSGNADAVIFSDNGNLFINADYDNTTADSSIRFRVDGSSEKMRISSSGNVGIGDTSPLAKLEIAGSKYVLTDSGQARGGIHLRPDSSSASGEYGGAISFSCGGSGSSAIAAVNEGGSDHDSNGLAFMTHASSTGGADAVEVMRIDELGNVGIGTTSPSQLLHLRSTGDAAIKIEADSDNANEDDNAYIEFSQDGGLVTGYVGFDTGTNTFIVANQYADGLILKTGDTERWRIDNAGRMTNGFDGSASSSFLQVAGNSVSGGVVNFIDPDVSVATSNHILRCTFSVDTDSQGKFIAFYDGGGNIGSISQNGAAAVSFNTTSDERLKENIVDASSQLNVVNNIQVREFDWKSSNKHDIGMIAQELNEVIPNVVQEGGDDVTEEPWVVDYAKLTPYLIKAIQEQQTIIDDLKSRIETLEG